MSVAARVAGAVAGVLGIAAAGAAVGAGIKHHAIVSREEEPHVPYGSLRGDPMVVVTDDGLDLYAEIDEVLPGQGLPGTEDLTIVWVHGFALHMDCWHEQRVKFRGRVRQVFYDQRSHGRSGRSKPEHCRIDQLGRDLQRVIETTTSGPVVVIAHSMGGMGLISMGEQFPEMLGQHVVGAGLISTTAGELDPADVLLPILPRMVGGRMVGTAIGVLDRGAGLVDAIRSRGQAIASILADTWAFGGPVGSDLIDFCTQMIDETSFEVVADFYPSFDELDLFDKVSLFSRIPTTIICGTKDRITKLEHSRRLHARIHGSDLIEVEKSGHLVLLERPTEVNAALLDLIGHVTRDVSIESA